jgi:hypothetical protein
LSFRSTLLCAGVAAALSLTGTLAHAGAPASNSCFLSANWSGWKSPSPNVIYLRVNANQIYQLDLSAGSSELQDGDVHLVNRIEGSDWICSPLDMQLEVADSHGGFREPLIVKSITRLTPEQVSAIPRKYLP